MPDISKWNISNTQDISGLFQNCSSLKLVPDISNWNTSNVTNMTSIFHNLSSLKALPDISKWNTQNIKYILFFCFLFKTKVDFRG